MSKSNPIPSLTKRNIQNYLDTHINQLLTSVSSNLPPQQPADKIQVDDTSNNNNNSLDEHPSSTKQTKNAATRSDSINFINFKSCLFGLLRKDSELLDNLLVKSSSKNTDETKKLNPAIDTHHLHTSTDKSPSSSSLTTASNDKSLKIKQKVKSNYHHEHHHLSKSRNSPVLPQQVQPHPQTNMGSHKKSRDVRYLDRESPQQSQLNLPKSNYYNQHGHCLESQMQSQTHHLGGSLNLGVSQSTNNNNYNNNTSQAKPIIQEKCFDEIIIEAIACSYGQVIDLIDEIIDGKSSNNLSTAVNISNGRERRCVSTSAAMNQNKNVIHANHGKNSPLTLTQNCNGNLQTLPVEDDGENNNNINKNLPQPQRQTSQNSSQTSKSTTSLNIQKISEFSQVQKMNVCVGTGTNKKADYENIIIKMLVCFSEVVLDISLNNKITGCLQYLDLFYTVEDRKILRYCVHGLREINKDYSSQIKLQFVFIRLFPFSKSFMRKHFIPIAPHPNFTFLNIIS